MSFKNLMASLTKQCGTIQSTSIQFQNPAPTAEGSYMYTASANGFINFSVRCKGWYVQKANITVCEAHFVNDANTGTTFPVKKGEVFSLHLTEYSGGRLNVNQISLENS